MTPLSPDKKDSAIMHRLLEHPLTRGLELDDPATTKLRRHIIKQKPLLRLAYLHWYETVLGSLPPCAGAVVEIGSGAGFLSELHPGIIRTDLLPLPFVDLSCSALELPFGSQSLRALVMINVLHHVPDPDRFFSEAERCLVPGGRVICIEPWVSSLSRLIYTRLHHEPFDPEVSQWAFSPSGPLSSANGALPWIIFVRDRERFLSRHPKLSILSIIPETNLSYFFSGGLSRRSVLPGMMHGPLRLLDKALMVLGPSAAAMFATVVVQKKKQAIDPIFQW